MIRALWKLADWVDVAVERFGVYVRKARTVLLSTVMALAGLAAAVQVVIVELEVEFPVVGQVGAQVLAGLAAVTEAVRRLATVVPEQRGIPEHAPDPRRILQ